MTDLAHPPRNGTGTADADLSITARHLRLLARADGYYEIRTLQRLPDDSVLPGPSAWLVVRDGALRNLSHVLAWIAGQHAAEREIYVGYNPRSRGGKNKADVTVVTACYADLDLHDSGLDAATVTALALPYPPSLIVGSGYGLHLIWFLTPSPDKALWRQVQLGLGAALSAYALDRRVLGDESRILRLAPWPNRKYGTQVPTALRHVTSVSYALDTLAAAYPAPPPPPEPSAPPRPGRPGRAEIPLSLRQFADAGQPQGQRNHGGFWLACRLIEEVADLGAARAVLDQYGARCSPAVPREELDRLWASAQQRTHYDAAKAAAGPPPPERPAVPPAPAPDPPPAAAAPPAPGLDGATYQPDLPALTDDAPDARPVIRVTDEIHRVRDQILAALEAANRPTPRLFQRGRQLVRVVDVEISGSPYGRIEAYTPESLRPRVAECARLIRWSSQAHADVVTTAGAAPLGAVLQADRFRFPALDGINEVPFVRPDGSICAAPGYDAATRLIYHPAPGLALPAVPETPTPADVAAARTLICDELLVDFPFTSGIERANAVALLLLPFVRSLIGGPTPLHLIEAPTPGSGKGLLAEMLLLPAFGNVLVSDTGKENDEEIDKWITAKVLRGAPVLWLDNVRAGINSATLASALTADIWSGRILGLSQTVEAPLRAVWVATANNPTLSTEIARRTVRIRIDPRMDRPQLRTGFRHEEPKAWVREHRGAIVAAALTLIRAWVCAGQPAGGQRLGSYERWAAVLGGILDVIALPGFLGNLLEVYDLADTEGTQWRALVAAWWEEYGPARVAAADLYTLAQNVDGFDLGKGGADKSHQVMRFARALGRQRDRIYSGLRIEHAGKEHRVARWALVPQEPEHPPPRGPDPPGDEGGPDDPPPSDPGVQVYFGVLLDTVRDQTDGPSPPTRDDSLSLSNLSGDEKVHRSTPSTPQDAPDTPRPTGPHSCGDTAWYWSAASTWECAACMHDAD